MPDDLVPASELSPSTLISLKYLHPELLLKEGELTGMERREQELDKEEQATQDLRKAYYLLIDLLRKYMVMEDRYYPIIAAWIIGTYYHEQFTTFPLLFINATRGSGKTRLLDFISTTSKDGVVLLALNEAVLFRTAKGRTLCIDEFENVARKENNVLRTLINAAYRKGATVERMKKYIDKGKEEYRVESFDLYTPLAMANIWGMDDVVQDRCITIMLDKSTDSMITRRIADFSNNANFSEVKRLLKASLVYKCRCTVPVERYNMYIDSKYIINNNIYTPTLDAHNTSDSPTTHTTYKKLTTQELEELTLFNKIDETKIEGRNMELFFPLFQIVAMMGIPVLDEFLAICKQMVQEKMSEEYAESKDVSLTDFIAQASELKNKFIGVHELTTNFRAVSVQDPEGEKWVNAHWLGRALKRLKLVKDKRRLAKGIEVIVDVEKAKILLERFKEVRK